MKEDKANNSDVIRMSAEIVELEEQLAAITAKCEKWEADYRVLFENSRQTRMRQAEIIRRMEEGEL